MHCLGTTSQRVRCNARCASSQVTRYQSTTFSLTYDEYQRLTEEGQHGAIKLRRQRQLVAVGAQS